MKIMPMCICRKSKNWPFSVLSFTIMRRAHKIFKSTQYLEWQDALILAQHEYDNAGSIT